MKKMIFILIALAFMWSCGYATKNRSRVVIVSADSVKQVFLEISYTDTLCLELPSAVSDSLIVASVAAASDSLRHDRVRRDSLHRINFRRITKLINGGYNGYPDREAIWIRAKSVLSQ